MNRRNFSIMLIGVVWVIWACLTLNLHTLDIDKSKIAVKTGTAISARCFESRYAKGVNFKVRYIGEKSAVGDYISLPHGYLCDSDLIEKFDDKPILISFYENHYLGFEVAGLSIFTIDESIENINSKGRLHLFTLFMAVVISICLAMGINGGLRGLRNRAGK